MKVIILKGLPGSGKSTWAKTYCEKNTNYIRVNRDDLRNMRGKYWLPKQEKLITAFEMSCIRESLIRGFSVIVDATNFNPTYFNKLKTNIETISSEFKVLCPDSEDIKIETKFFDTPLKECIKRDMARPNSVGEKVIREMYDKYLKPKTETIKQNPKLKPAIIVDLDGTLAIHNGRNPFEYDKCDTDLVNKPVSMIVKKFLLKGGWKIIYLSGREDSCKDKSIQWLKENNLWDETRCKVFMRKTGDFRKDSVVKKEIFENNIKDVYYIDFILDDRNQVVKMWRELGLTCLQVAEGDF